MPEKTMEFRICPNCGYQRGFHVHFRELSKGRVTIGLICPSCGQSYDTGWTTSDIPGLEIKKEERFGE